MSDTAVRVSGLSLAFGDREILRDVSFDVAHGDFLCVIGKNGAGKSTLFKCIAGICRNYRGAIEIAGRSIRRMKPRELAQRVAFVPQTAPDDMPYTVAEFLEMSRYPWKNAASRAADRRAAQRAIELTALTELADRRLNRLSGGERQRVMIAAAVAQETEIVLLDEPTTYLDYAHQIETMRLIAQIKRERNLTALAVTHDINTARRLAQSVLAMRDGQIAWRGTPQELLDPDRLREIYGVAFRLYYPQEGGEAPLAAPFGAAQ